LDRLRDRLALPGVPGLFRRGVQLGTLAALIFLARTDMFVVAFVVLAWLIRRQRRLDAAVIGFCAACALVVLPYLLWNYLSQQSVMPISGRVKLHYMSVFLPTLKDYLHSDEWQGSLAAFDSALNLRILPVRPAIRFPVIGALLLSGLGAICLARGTKRVPTSVKLFTVIVWIHLLFMHVAHRELRPYTSYYFAPAVLWLGVAATTSLGLRLGPHVSAAWMVRSALVGGACALVALGWAANPYGAVPSWVQRVALAADIQRLIPADEKVAAFWPGCFAHFGGRSVVPSDGIIGSNAYFTRYVKSDREFEYLREKRVRYLVIRLFEGDYERITDRGRAATPPRIRQWDNLGIRRLYENRHVVRRTMASRTTADGGWYLFELDGR
jgi:hypothetical protein